MATIDLTDSQMQQLNQIMAATGMKPEPPKPEGPKRRCKVMVSPRPDHPGFGACGRYWISGEHEAHLTDVQIAEIRSEPACRFMMVFVYGVDSEPISAEVAKVAAERDAAAAEVERLKEQLQALTTAKGPPTKDVATPVAPASGRGRG